MRTIRFVLISFVLLGWLVSCSSPETPATQTTPEDSASGQAAASPTAPLDVDLAASDLPPGIVERSPLAGQRMALGAGVRLVFSQAMDTTATAAGWQFADMEGHPVDGELEWLDERSLTFQPASPLEPGAIYTGTLENVTPADGLALEDSIELEFLTVDALQVSQVFPSDATSEIAVNTPITAIFNRPVVPLTIFEEQSELPQPLSFEPEVEGTGEWINTSVYVFTPDDLLQSDTFYDVAIDAALTSVDGVSLGEDFGWGFSTVTPSIQNFGIVGGTSNPANYHRNVFRDDAFWISFRQPMDPGSFQEALTLRNLDSAQTVAVTLEWNEAFTSVEITPRRKLDINSEYRLRLLATAEATTGGTLQSGIEWTFTTLPLPGVESVTPADGSIQEYFFGDININFRSPMNPATFEGRIQLSPELEGDLDWFYYPYGWSLNIFGLQPSTEYELRLLPGMADIYGNRIQEETVVTFTTAARSPYAYLNMPYTTTIYRDGSELAFYTDYSNVSEIEYSLYSISSRKYSQFIKGTIYPQEYRPQSDDLINQWAMDSQVDLNERGRVKHLLGTESGDPLQPGYYLVGINVAEIDNVENTFEDARVFVVASANLTLKTTTTEALTWVTDLDSGEPLADVQVRVYNKNFKQLAVGETDGDGLFYAEDIGEGYFALIDDPDELGFAAITWGNGVRLGDFGVSTNYYTPPNATSVYLYTDRPLYRPGQTVSFKGILRLNDDLTYTIPEDEQVLVKIEAFGEVIYEKTLRLSDFGSFDGALLLDQDAQLGSYQIRVYYPHGEDEQAGGLSFSVGEYRKPEFQLNIQAQEDAVLGGQDFTVDIGAEYFSGGGVAEAALEWTLLSTPYTFQPGGDYRRFSFRDLARDSGYYYFSPDYTETIAEGEALTDADGRVALTLDAELAESGQARQLALLANVTDVAGNLVGGRTGVVVHSSLLYAGVRPLNYVGEAEEEQSFQMVVLDWDAQPVPEHGIDVEVVERRWYSVQELDEQGQLRWVTSVEEIPVFSQNGLVTDEDGLAQVDFIPPTGGVYKATVTTRDTVGNQARASSFLWVSGSEFVSWRQNNDRSFELVADKDEYQPGDTAEILIASPFQESVHALITVERGHIRSQEVLELTSNSTVYKLPIEAGMAPNIYVSVVVIRGLDEATQRPDFKMSVIELNVDTSQQELIVEVTTNQEEAGPGDEVSYTVRTTDKSGQPVQAELSLALADLAALSLSSPNSRTLLSHFYSTRSLGVRTAVPILLDAALYNEEFEGTEGDGTAAGSGGGKGSGLAGVVEIREDFPDTALWEAHVITDEDGEATISVTLPDNLTTWRMDARAFTQDMSVGQNTQDLISTKPLLVRPQTPRFFVTGDEAQVGTAVNNNTEEELDVEVSIDAEGLSVDGALTQTITIPAGRQAYVYWDVAVQPDAERVDLVFSANGGQYQDASRPTLGSLEDQGIPVYAFEAPETVGTAGVLYEGDTRTEAIALPSAFEVSEGDLTIELAPSLAAGMTEGLDYLKHYPYECMEQTVSRFLPNVITSQALQAAGISDAKLQANLDAQVNVALQRIYGRQNADGGWGWWSTQKSQVQTSAYVVLGLVEAEEAGYQIDNDVLKDGVVYLGRQVKFVNTLDRPHLYNQQAFLLYVLARAGSERVGHSVQLFNQRESLSLYGRAYLAQTLHIIDPQDDRLDDLISDLAGAAILSAAGAHWQEEWRDYWNWNTDTRTTAIVLKAFVQIDPDSELNPAAVRWLMSHREGGHWRSTQETAWTLMALTGWMVHAREFESQYQYLVALNEEVMGEGVASTGNLTDTLKLQVDVADLLQEEINRLTFARDDGTGNLYYTTYMNVNLPVEGIEPLDQGIILSRSYYAVDDLETPLTEVQQGDLVRARLTIVIPNDLHYLVIDDPLPAGLEAVDRSLLTSAQVPETYSWSAWREIGWGWWYFDHVELRDEKLVLSADYLPAGTYTYTYIARAGLPGEYRVIPPTAQEFYFPDVYGRGAGSLFTVLP